MKKIIIMAIMLLPVFWSRSQNIVPDSGFGNNGVVITHGKDTANIHGEFAKQIFPQLDGKMLVVLDLGNFSLITRRFPDGSVDSSYGKNGFSESIQGGAISALRQQDGKLVVACNINMLNSDFVIGRVNTDGTLDASFGNGGIVKTDAGGDNDYVYAVAIQPDGKIVSGGRTNRSGSNQFVLMRHNSNGTLDASFGTNGIMTTGFDDPSSISAIVIEPAGKIIAVGNVSNTSTNRADFAVARYYSNGTLDPSFDLDGKLTTDLGIGDNAVAGAIQSDGKLLVAGFSLGTAGFCYKVIRYNQNGELDLTYNGTGIASACFNAGDAYLQSIVLQSDGKLLAAGSVGQYGQGNAPDQGLVRFNTDGSIDGGFGNQGEVSTDVSGYPDGNYCIAIQSDGKIIAGGSSWTGPSYDFTLTRFNIDGTPDLSFARGGTLISFFPASLFYYGPVFPQTDGKLLALGNSYDRINSINFLQRFNADGTVDNTYGQNGLSIVTGTTAAALPDGKMIVTGVNNASNVDIALFRYNADGSLDSGFGANGMAVTDFGGDEYPACIAVQSDHKILVGGYMVTGSINGQGKTDLIITRYNSDGTPDNSFGSGGKIITDFQDADYPQQLVLGTDGKILIAGTGYTYTNNYSTLADVLMARYNSDGSPDASFGQGSKKIIDFGEIDAAGSLVIQQDGKILLGKLEGNFDGFICAVRRYHSSGVPDSSFGDNGKINITSSNVTIILQDNQKILVGAVGPNDQNTQDSYLARFNTDGSPDYSLGNGGKLINSFAAGTDQVNALLLSNNRLFLSGSSISKSMVGIIAKYSLDTQSHVIVPPVIRSFSPQSAVPGSTLTIYGAHFSKTAANNIVYFGAVKATVGAATDTSLAVTVPFGATYQPITVTVNNLTAYSAQSFIATSGKQENITSGSFMTEFIGQTGTYPSKLAISDLDGDGKSDFVTTNFSSSDISIFKNVSPTDTIILEPQIKFAVGRDPDCVAVGDLNGDGRPDLVVPSIDDHNLYIFVNQSTPGVIAFAPALIYAMGLNDWPRGIAIQDLDGDGKPDIVVPNNNVYGGIDADGGTVSVLRNTSSGANISFADKVDYKTQDYPRAVFIEDLNNDGKPDFAVTNNRSGNISVFKNKSSTGTLEFEPKVDYATGIYPEAVSITDLDGDNRPDLAVTNSGSQTISIFKNISSGETIAFAEKQDIGAATRIPLKFTIGDLNGDGKPDIAIGLIDSFAIYRNTSTIGAISFSPAINYYATGFSIDVSVGDLDNDGKPDLAVVNGNSNTIYALRNRMGEHALAVHITNPANGAFYPAGSTISLQASATDSNAQIKKVEFYNNGIKFATDSTAPYEITAGGVEAGNYMLTAKAFNSNGDSAVSDTVSITVTSCSGTGNILAEGYANIPGQYVSNLTSNPKFPISSDVSALLDKFEYGPDIADNYGGRIRGYVCAPLTGNYIFYLASDEQSELWLSTNDNPGNKIKIAYLNSRVPFRGWNTYYTQKSAPIHLIKGVRYYIEALHKESTGSDHLSVAWILPSGTGEFPIPASRLSPWDYNQPLVSSFGGGMQNIQQGLTVAAGPNPSSGYFILTTRSSSDERISITVTDVLGKTIEKRLDLQANGTIQFGSDYGPGMYFVEIIQGTERKRIKLIRQ